MIGPYLILIAAHWLVRLAVRLLAWTMAVLVLVAAAPVTTVAVIAVAGAWLRGWPPSRLRRAAAWSLPMTGIYVAVRASRAPGTRSASAASSRRSCCARRSRSRPGC